MESKENLWNQNRVFVLEQDRDFWKCAAEKHQIRAFLYKVGFAISVGLNAAWWLM